MHDSRTAHIQPTCTVLGCVLHEAAQCLSLCYNPKIQPSAANLTLGCCVAAKGKPPKLVEAKKEVDPTEAPIITLKFQVSQRKVGTHCQSGS